MRITRALLAAACAAAVLFAPTAARANPPSFVTTLTCHSGTGPTAIISYGPKISMSNGFFNVGGPLWCRMQRSGNVTWNPMLAEGRADFTAFGSFAKVVDGTGAASGTMLVDAFGARFELPFVAPFAAGNAAVEIANAWDTDGGRNGLGAGVFNEPVVCIPGCISTATNYAAFTVTLQDVL